LDSDFGFRFGFGFVFASSSSISFWFWFPFFFPGFSFGFGIGIGFRFVSFQRLVLGLGFFLDFFSRFWILSLDFDLSLTLAPLLTCRNASAMALTGYWQFFLPLELRYHLKRVFSRLLLD
jgi:hypothetical protein